MSRPNLIWSEETQTAFEELASRGLSARVIAATLAERGASGVSLSTVARRLRALPGWRPPSKLSVGRLASLALEACRPDGEEVRRRAIALLRSAASELESGAELSQEEPAGSAQGEPAA